MSPRTPTTTTIDVSPEQHEQLHTYLDRLFATIRSGYKYELRPLNKRTGAPKPIVMSDTLDTLEAAAIDAILAGDDVYVGAIPRRAGLRGDAACDVFDRLWADIDYGTEGHSVAQPHPDQASALAALSGLPAPSLLVHTGGGLQAIWLLDRDLDRSTWTETMRRLSAAIRSDANVNNPERILRVPGSYNHKLPLQLRNATLLASHDSPVDAGPFLELPPVACEVTPIAHGRELRALSSAGHASPHDAANEIPIADVLRHLGVAMKRVGSVTHCACPVHGGTNQTQCQVGGKINRVTCYGDCKSKAHSVVDVVMAVKGMRKSTDAAFWILREFGRVPVLGPIGSSPPATADVKSDTNAEPSDWRQWLATKNNGVVIPSPANVTLIITHHPDWQNVLAFDELKVSVVLTCKPPFRASLYTPHMADDRWLDVDTTAAVEWFQNSEFGLQVGRDDVRDAVESCARKHVRNRTVEYLDSLIWDGVERLDHWLVDYAGVEDTPYARAVSRYFVVTAAARALYPGCKVDSVVVFEGPQGCGKSRMLRALAIENDWFFDSDVDMKTKEGPMVIQGRWIVELQELACLKAVDPTQSKAFITRTQDVLRPAFGREVLSLPRRCVFAGTTNDSDYLTDTTGNRRWLPIKVGQTGDVNVEAVREAAPQIWAEAVTIARRCSDDDLQLDRRVAAEAAAEQADRVAEDAWDTVILKYTRSTNVSKRLTYDDIFEIDLKVDPKDRDNRALARMRAILVKYGWKPGKSHGSRVWVHPKANPKN